MKQLLTIHKADDGTRYYTIWSRRGHGIQLTIAELYRLREELTSKLPAKQPALQEKEQPYDY